MKKRKKSGLLFSLLLMLLVLSTVPVHAMSNTYRRVEYGHWIQMGTGRQFQLKWGGSTSYGNLYVRGFDLYVRVNGSSKKVASNVGSDAFTNGVYTYYIRAEKKLSSANPYVTNTYDTIYRYNLVTGQSKKITSGRNYRLIGAYWKYLYAGPMVDMSGASVKLYAFHTGTGTRKYMTECDEIIIGSKRVATMTTSGALENHPLSLFNINGTNEVIIGEGRAPKIKNKKVYYLQVRYSDWAWKFRLMSCALDGSGKKVVKNWSSAEPTY